MATEMNTERRPLLTFLLMAILLLAMTACQSTRMIVHGIDEHEANEIIVLLQSENILAYKFEEKAAVGGAGPKVLLWDVAVNQVDATAAMAVLSANGLPRKKSPNLLDLFTASGLVPSDTTETIRYETGLADTLANTIRKIDGIVDANVILSFPKENPLNPAAKTPPITAAVFVKHTGVLNNPNSLLITKIKELVSSSVSGLAFDNVTVIPDLARFSLPSISFLQAPPQEYFDVWGLVIAKSSLERFQITFLTLSLLFFLLAFGILWLAFKLYPILRKCGLKELLALKPLPETFIEPELEKVVEEASIEKSASTPAEQKNAQENVEE